METALMLIVPALIGLATGAVATAYKSRKDLEVQYDIKLREERIAAYKALWNELDRLAYYAPARPLTYGVAKELAAALRAWYFDIGGLLMSASTREPYFDLQRALKAVEKRGGDYDTELDEDTQKALKQLGSRLRTSTTDDVATRVGSLLGAWFRPRRRSGAEVTVARGWTFDRATAGAWRVRVVNRSHTRPLPLERVWLDAKNERDATPLDEDRPVRRTLYPREAWQGFVSDEEGLMDGVADPFRAFRASGPGWVAWSKPAGDPPASPIPAEPDGEEPPGA